MIKLRVVGDKRHIPCRFHNRVAASFYLEQGVVSESWPAQVQGSGTLRKTGEYVEVTQCGGCRLQWGERFRYVCNQRLIKVFFPRQCAAFAGKRLVFEGFEFGRNEPLDIFQRLAALIGIGRLF